MAPWACGASPPLTPLFLLRPISPPPPPSRCQTSTFTTTSTLSPPSPSLFREARTPLSRSVRRLLYRCSPTDIVVPAVLLEEGREVLGSKEEEKEEDEEGKEEKEEEVVSRVTLIWRAVKLPIYSVALVPLTVGSSAAYLQTGLFFARRYLVLLSASILIIAWLNLSNDVYDFDTGADRNKKESVVNILGSQAATHLAANASLAFGFIGLIWACTESGDIRTIFLLAFAILCGYVYQSPPFRLGYHGLGEPLCFAAFGPFATTAFYFYQGSKSLSGTVLSASLLVGLTTTLILFCSHFHQVDGDRAVGKMSPLVRIGTRTGSKVVKVAILALYSVLFVLGISKAIPGTCAFLCALTLPVGKLVANFVEENHEDKVVIFMAKYYCVRLHALFGAALAAGLVLARTGAKV